jgi:hypothetical protein
VELLIRHLRASKANHSGVWRQQILSIEKT